MFAYSLFRETGRLEAMDVVICFELVLTKVFRYLAIDM